MSNPLPIQTPGCRQTERWAKQSITVLPDEVEILSVVNKFLGCIRYLHLLLPQDIPN